MSATHHYLFYPILPSQFLYWIYIALLSLVHRSLSVLVLLHSHPSKYRTELSLLNSGDLARIRGLSVTCRSLATLLYSHIHLISFFFFFYGYSAYFHGFFLSYLFLFSLFSSFLLSLPLFIYHFFFLFIFPLFTPLYIYFFFTFKFNLFINLSIYFSLLTVS